MNPGLEQGGFLADRYPHAEGRRISRNDKEKTGQTGAMDAAEKQRRLGLVT